SHGAEGCQKDDVNEESKSLGGVLSCTPRKNLLTSCSPVPGAPAHLGPFSMNGDGMLTLLGSRAGNDLVAAYLEVRWRQSVRRACRPRVGRNRQAGFS